MHMQLLPNDKIIAFDRKGSGPSNISLPRGKCVVDSKTTTDCSSHSVEFDPSRRRLRPLTITTDTWCSSGALLPDGVLIQSGGFGLGERVVRSLTPCADCDWVEQKNGLITSRWYASNQILPNGKIIVVGGLNQFNYEFIPKTSTSDQKLYQLPFLEETRYSPFVPNNLYPFLHLTPDGKLFIFANDRAILLDHVNNRVVKNYPVMPGGVSRNYPSTVPDSNQKAIAGVFVPASKSCGRLVITANNPSWKMEQMPLNRLMGDMILLPTGDVLIINGAAKGSAGWNVAHLLSDGRVLVGGSNPNSNYNFTAVYPTELSVEAFYPPYFSPNVSRPLISKINPGTNLEHMQKFSMHFHIHQWHGELGKIHVTMVAPSFTSHSYSMNQRLLVLSLDSEARKVGFSNYAVDVHAPATATLAPPGYYQLFVVHEGVPSKGTWVHIK
ncbi:hypothetical protein OIU76_017647 [Salix suchowensis]|nr:hypothetical protein OIU76_017647 [Salix suchowensis]